MASLEIINNKLYLKFYDPVKKYTRRKSLKMKNTEANRRAARKVVKNYNPDYIDSDYIDEKEAVFFKPAVKHFLKYNNYAKGTEDIYNLAADHFVKACGNKIIKDYQEKDYIMLKKYFNDKGFKQNTKSIYTRALHKIFKYFIKKGYCINNIILIFKQQDGSPSPIPKIDLNIIMNKLREKLGASEAYYFFKILLNTGIRISTLLELRWEDIHLKSRLITFKNVKVNNKYYQFPITPTLKKIFDEMGMQMRGKVFQYKNRHSLKIIYRVQDDLFKERRYHIHQFKHTFISEMASQGVPLDFLSELTNTSYRTLKKYYAQYNLLKIGQFIGSIEL